MTGWVAAALIMLGPVSQAVPEGRIDSIEVRLFDTANATFGENVLDASGTWGGWNTFGMEGNGGHGRGDAMVLVRIASAQPGNGYAYAEGTLTISAFRDGKLLVRRKFKEIGLPRGKPASQALYLEDVGCSGDIKIEAEYRDQVARAKLGFACGE